MTNLSERIVWIVAVVSSTTALFATIPALKTTARGMCMEFDKCAITFICPDMSGTWERLNNSAQKPQYTQTGCHLIGEMPTDGYSHTYDGRWDNDRFVVAVSRVTLKETGDPQEPKGCKAEIKAYLYPGAQRGGPTTYRAVTIDPSTSCKMNPASDPYSDFKKISASSSAPR